MRIVGDSLVQESVQYGTDVPQEGKKFSGTNGKAVERY